METYAQREIEPQLGAGEELLWAGRPYQGLFLLRPSDAFLIPFSFLWLGFVIAALIGAQKAGESDPLMVLLVFGTLGLYLVLGRFVIDARQRQRTFYGLTDQRVIIVRGLLQREVKSINLKTISDLSLSERRDGFGTIKFGASNLDWYMAAGMEIFTPGIASGTSFIRIPKAKQVYDQIRGAQ